MQTGLICVDLAIQCQQPSPMQIGSWSKAGSRPVTALEPAAVWRPGLRLAFV